MEPTLTGQPIRSWFDQHAISQTGSYAVLVSNDYGFVLSSNAALMVLDFDRRLCLNQPIRQ